MKSFQESRSRPKVRSTSLPCSWTSRTDAPRPPCKLVSSSEESKLGHSHGDSVIQAINRPWSKCRNKWGKESRPYSVGSCSHLSADVGKRSRDSHCVARKAGMHWSAAGSGIRAYTQPGLTVPNTCLAIVFVQWVPEYHGLFRMYKTVLLLRGQASKNKVPRSDSLQDPDFW